MLGYREHDPDTVRAQSAITGGRFVKQGTVEKSAIPCSAQGEYAIGVAKFDIASGDVGLIHQAGSVGVMSAEAIAVGDEITTSVNGRCETCNAGDYLLGVAETAVDGADEEVIVKLSQAKVLKA